LPLAGISPLAELFQLCLTNATPIDVMGLKQRSAPNKHKLKGGAGLVPPLFFGGQQALYDSELARGASSRNAQGM
jgi:hypothetical protein